MIRFECDYAEGAHPKIMEKLMQTNMEQTIGYSEDKYCDEARELLKKLCNAPSSDVHFLVGGTQTNTTFIASVLRPYQGVISASTGHINVHETGAIESTGHKVLALESKDGKISAQQVKNCYLSHYNDESYEHMVQPGMVYISFPTENGTLYSKSELIEMHDVCKELNLPLYIDGARLGYGLNSPKNDLKLTDFVELCDAFYIGGTKEGMLFGEAIVINNPNLQKDFRYMIKQKGGMFAKGRLLGLQYLALFENDLYNEISLHADKLALKIRAAFEEKGISMLYDSYTNQQYPILPNGVLKELAKRYSYSFWCAIDEANSAVRFCTSWATKTEDVDELLKDIDAIL